MDSFGAEDFPEDLRKITLPTLVIHPDEFNKTLLSFLID
jgi:hypothetical protein